MQEIKITNETMPALAFNYEQLREWATELAARYANQVVTEDVVIAVKKDMAALNHAKKAVDDARKETVRRISEPIRIFESKIKEICVIFDDAYEKLAKEVKIFDDARRKEKAAAIQSMVNQCYAEIYGEEDWPDIGISKQMNEKWLNKTTSMKSIKEDVHALIREYKARRQQEEELERARQDRIVAIENRVAALNNRHGMNISVARYLSPEWTAPSRTLEDIYGAVDADFRRYLPPPSVTPAPAPSAAATTPVVETPPPSVPAEPAPSTAPAPEASSGVVRACSVVFSYDAALEDEIQTALANIKRLSINFAVRSK
jgi:hypothetical protein